MPGLLGIIAYVLFFGILRVHQRFQHQSFCFFSWPSLAREMLVSRSEESQLGVVADDTVKLQAE
jgi:hypothetical protein